MILVDSTAWIEYLRATGTPADLRIQALLRAGEPIATTDFILMKVLAGARGDEHRDRLRRLIAGCSHLPTDAPGDYERAADLYRNANAAGTKIRRLPECVTAVIAIRHDVALLHADRGFDAIAEFAPLRIASMPAAEHQMSSSDGT
ncbi:MAG TPA: PIN domain nuclease [Solirubrobacteraceae bacterium]|jgi:hypothetical protein|nr:PIN domain nuclease [Solirubrobacteraceae bacterium]